MPRRKRLKEWLAEEVAAARAEAIARLYPQEDPYWPGQRLWYSGRLYEVLHLDRQRALVYLRYWHPGGPDVFTSGIPLAFVQERFTDPPYHAQQPVG